MAPWENYQIAGRKLSHKIYALTERTSKVQVSVTMESIKQTNRTNPQRFCTSVRIICLLHHYTENIINHRCRRSEAKRDERIAWSQKGTKELRGHQKYIRAQRDSKLSPGKEVPGGNETLKTLYFYTVHISIQVLESIMWSACSLGIRRGHVKLQVLYAVYACVNLTAMGSE